MESKEFDIYPTIAKGMGPDLHWFPEDVSLANLTATLVAMANTAGGTILLGISPRSGHIQGVRDVGSAFDRVFQACLFADPTLVLPVPRLIKVGMVEILQIVVPQGLPQVYSSEGRYYWREGRQSNLIPPRQLRRLLVERGHYQFESQVPPGVTLEDLDAEQVELYVQEYLAAFKSPSGDRVETPQELLLHRGCLKRAGDKILPTYAALLLFGHSPQHWLPTADILAARFTGVSYGDHFVKQEISGPLLQQLQRVEKFLRSNLQRVVRMIGFTHQETHEYPLDAVRELIVNAVAHRDYNAQGDNIHLNIFSDRLEVTSPGGLPGPISIDNILVARFSRNPVIVQVLSDLGYVERLGYGLDRVVTLMGEHSLPPPKFEEVPGGFRVTLINTSIQDVSGRDMSKYQSLELNPRQIAALNYLSTHRRIANREYQDLCPEVHAETLRRDFADLVSKGILIKIGDKKTTYYILK